MKKAVMYGAGKIGRGFMGKVFSDSGYDVCFFDRIQWLVDELNARGSYTVRIVSNESQTDEPVGPVRALNSETEPTDAEIAGCDVMATAVGVNELPNIAPVIARGMTARMNADGRPLNIILCENQIGADRMMRNWIYESLDEAQRAWADANLGLVPASISRMVPPVTEEMLKEDALLIRVDPYSKLPVDRLAFRGGIPDLVGLVPSTPFEFFIKCKLFLNNGGHALIAYLGYEKGYAYIWQALEDEEIYEAARASMLTSGRALTAKFGEEVSGDMTAFVDNLLYRFRNKALMDTVARVGADPLRKLRRNDRIIGAALFAMEQGFDPAPIVRGVLAALKFDRPDDITAPTLQRALSEQGIGYVMEHYMGLNAGEPLYGMILDAYRG